MMFDAVKVKLNTVENRWRMAQLAKLAKAVEKDADKGYGGVI